MLRHLLSGDLIHIDKKLASVKEDLRDKKIFITGGTGFFGKWLIQSLDYLNMKNNLNLTLFLLTRNKNKTQEMFETLSINRTYFEGSLSDFKVKGLEIDYVIHGAADASSIHSPRSTKGISGITEEVQKLGQFSLDSHVVRFLNISSGAVYGEGSSFLESEIIDENNLKTNYSVGKLRSEKLLNDLSIDGSLVIVHARCFSFAGAYLPADRGYAVENFISSRLKHEKIKVTGDGLAGRSYMHPGDLVVWLLTILLKGRNNEIYNVGNDDEITITNLERLINSFFDKEEYLPKKMCPGKNYYIPNIKKANSFLSLSNSFTSQEVVEQYCQWCLNYQN
ncbi:MAG: NAD(P)-dependent oxidoreductase [Halobacteriovoraceae bacterium]|jgi:nucleoside-diphosphate-sugar epimerase|nr:NAD(P)-dependent oxidoreductase [Halobacteriovoraceae bacterium]